MTREDYVEKIRKAKAQLGTAGVIHKKDLQRYIRRLEKELRIYDGYHRGWSSLGEKATMKSG
jgi:hypothetical protein